ncbi:hypothetical protein T440DRAFT_41571 [Plenodomus tracheiphilus IPT5]|uniref:Uncharacterized protein n=1 Tax=Plenodomus tracheiphilus IPT5 TaxID=1408161 RepID=A0A6A7BDW7_9PLEO|nr:hypothetical protein T440DRAFT_41571 [Plenodomus tracheiphilus IPT5]
MRPQTSPPPHLLRAQLLLPHCNCTTPDNRLPPTGTLQPACLVVAGGPVQPDLARPLSGRSQDAAHLTAQVSATTISTITTFSRRSSSSS